MESNDIEYLSHIAAGEQHFNELQGTYRRLASTWVLATIAAVGFVLTSPAFEDTGNTYLMGLAVVSFLGIALLWVIDVDFYHLLLLAYYREGCEFEADKEVLIHRRMHARHAGTLDPSIFYVFAGERWGVFMHASCEVPAYVAALVGDISRRCLGALGDGAYSRSSAGQAVSHCQRGREGGGEVLHGSESGAAYRASMCRERNCSLVTGLRVASAGSLCTGQTTSARRRKMVDRPKPGSTLSASGKRPDRPRC